MERLDILGIFLLSLIVFIGIKFYVGLDTTQLTCVISDVDGNKYCVRDRNIVPEAADKLARTVTKCNSLIAYLKQNHPSNMITKRLVERFNPDKVSETLPTSEHTAYSENKGKKLAFCLNASKTNNNKLIDDNTLMFVALHELAHIGTIDVGHNPVYWNNFKFILENAVKADLYVPVDYKKQPMGYCGMTITDNPYYDL